MDGTARSQGKYEFDSSKKKQKTAELFSRVAAPFAFS